uniref:Large ribosomal subunit protein uL4c n=1 Tax=Spyridia filamentosa TaxID=196632 RepID=A0A1Z1MK35_SPYFI|nr:ribosomal protein L4 [Spyridia filamentosa]ARW66249.1 ribosomal protein L4 [Spyridia filamentosa]
MKITKKLTYNINEKIIISNSLEESQNLDIKIDSNDEKNMYIIHRVIKQQLHVQRHMNANTKTRSEVRGGGRKPWKQKGTGKARAGSIRSPLWRGGGVIFGPRKQKNNIKINKKEKRLAIQILIHNKFPETIAVKDFGQNLQKASTKSIKEELKKFNIDNKKILIIVNKKTKELYLSTRNLPNIELIEVKNINALSLIRASNIIITIDSIKAIHKKYNE